jgi:ABC-type transporter Mla subunit MlaD
MDTDKDLDNGRAVATRIRIYAPRTFDALDDLVKAFDVIANQLRQASATAADAIAAFSAAVEQAGDALAEAKEVLALVKGERP